jgi:putative endopeptidase
MKTTLTGFFIMALLIVSSCSPKDMAIDVKNMDLSVAPGEDFYQYSNGGWMAANPLPGEFSRYGSFDKLAEDNQKMVRALIEEASAAADSASELHRKVGLFYRTGMDTLKIEAEGMNPLAQELDLIEMTSSAADVMNLIIHQHRRGNSMLFLMAGAPDRKNSNMVIANLYQGGLGLTDVDYYRGSDERSVAIRERYKAYIAELMGIAGTEPALAGEWAEKVLSLETRLAGASLTRLERRDPHRTYNKMNLEALEKLAPAIDWAGYFSGVGLTDIGEVNVGMPEFFAEVSRMLGDVPLEDWKVYFRWHLLNNSAPYLSSAFVNSNFEFYGRFLSGKQVNQPRWKRVLQMEDFALGEAIGQMFVEKHFPPEAKERMMSLVYNLRIALGDRIETLEWMSDTTKTEALAKLDAMNVKIGYPDKWRDYSGLEVSDDSYFANIMRAARFNQDYRMSKIGKPVDPEEWGMTPQTVNAYYSPNRNEIVFPAGILQPPFFYLDADDAVNYGAIGVVIGHEMTHGFDDQGRQYDKEGNLRDWWTAEDATRFSERAQVLVDQYNRFMVADSVYANGKLSLGENIADLGGLNISFAALQKAWEIHPPKGKINGFTPEQRFFLAYSHVWAQNITKEEILRRTREDVHSLGRFRVNGPLPNVEAFYQAFNIAEDAPMYLPVEQRAEIW